MFGREGTGKVLACLLCVFMICGAFAAPADNMQDETILFKKELSQDAQEFKVLRTDDKFEMNRYITRAWELKHADAYEILPHIKKVVQAEKGQVRTMKYKDPESGKTRYFVQVVAPEFQIEGIAEMIKVLDLPGMESSEGDVKYNCRLLYRDAAEIAGILRNTSLSGEGAVAFDTKTNSIWIKDSISDFKKDLATLKFYDVPVPQVSLDIEIVEVETDDSSKLGLQWDAWKNALGGAYSYRISRSNAVDNTLADSLSPAIKTLRGYDALLTLDATVLADFLNYMIENGHARVVTRSRVLVSNGETGVISSLRKIPYETYSTDAIRRLKDAVNTTDPGASLADPAFRMGEKAEGLHIEARPNISLKSTTLDASITVNSLSGFTNQGMPIITERKTLTNAALRDGEKFTLGIFDKETLVKEKSKVALLGDIPLLGTLFMRNVEVKRNSKIIVQAVPAIKSLELSNATVLDGNTLDAEPLLKQNPADFADTEF
ncbi:MAG TPA: hypothetical protein PLB62_00425 [Candidatus Sumerlaeota bacterium]|nr:hypothetical protein [Candidatus Sumerlaeota bacterium]